MERGLLQMHISLILPITTIYDSPNPELLLNTVVVSISQVCHTAKEPLAALALCPGDAFCQEMNGLLLLARLVQVQ